MFDKAETFEEKEYKKKKELNRHCIVSVVWRNASRELTVATITSSKIHFYQYF
jgi:hypothetical protein